MKIIGQGSYEEMIVLATRDELAQIAGYAGHYTLKTENDGRGLEVGRTIHVSRAYGVIRTLRLSPRKVSSIRELLADVAAALEPLEDKTEVK